MNSIKEVVQNIYWSLLLQGLLFVLLAVLIVVYPALLVALVAATFLLLGVGLLALAWKVRAFWDKIPTILK